MRDKLEQSHAKKLNKLFAEKCVRFFDPTFRHRWEVYNDTLSGYLSNDKLWIDIGCGKAETLQELGTKAKYAVGIDVLPPVQGIFRDLIQADIRAVPIRSESVDVVTLRFVAEHLEYIPDDLLEIARVLKPGGVLILLTTNVVSPFIALPRLFPYRLKEYLIRTIYRVKSQDVFPTFHRFNSGLRIKRGTKDLHLIECQYLQDANFVRKWVFVIFFGWHLLTKVARLEWTRTNIIAVLEKR